MNATIYFTKSICQHMAEVGKSILDKDTLVPLSFVITIMVLISGGIVSHTTMSNRIDTITTDVRKLEQEMTKMEGKYISRELFEVRFDRVQKDLEEIKTLLKKQQ